MHYHTLIFVIDTIAKIQNVFLKLGLDFDRSAYVKLDNNAKE